VRAMSSITTSTTRARANLSVSVRVALVLLGIAIAAFGVDFAGNRIPPTSTSRKQLVEAIDDYAMPVCHAALLAAATMLAFRLLAVLKRPGHRRRNHQVLLSVAMATGLPYKMLRLKTAWNAAGRLTGATLRYQAGTPLPANLTKSVMAALAHFAQGNLECSHDPASRTIQVYPPAEVGTWWQKADVDPGASTLLDSIHATLSGLLRDIRIDDRRTTLAPAGDTTLAPAGAPDASPLAPAPDGASFQVVAHYGATTKDTSDAFRARVRQILTQKAPSPTGAWVLIWLPHEQRVIIRPAVPLPDRVDHGDLDLSNAPRHGLPLGVREDGTTAWWNPSRYPHLLIAGSTGGGKSVTLRTITVRALIAGWEVYIVDAKKVGFRRGFGCGWGISNAHIATTGEDMEAIILAVHHEMKRRYHLIETGQAELADFAPLLLIADENTEVLAEMNEWAKERWLKQHPDKPNAPKGLRSPAVDAEWSIARLGREVGCYLVLAHQRPDVRYIPGEARDNMVSVYAAGPLSPQGVNMLFGTYDVEQRVYKQVQREDGQFEQVAVPGRATVNLGQGPEPIQGCWTPKPEEVTPGSRDEALVNQLREQARAAQEAAGHELLPGITSPLPADGAVSRSRRSRSAITAGDGGDQHDEPSGNAAGTELPKVADEVFVEDLVEGDVVYAELDGEQVKISVLGLLEADDGIELEYQIIDDNHPDVGERASLILPEGELLRRGTETDQ